MSRPTSKAELLKSGTVQFEKLYELLESLTEQEQCAAFDFSADVNKKEAHWRRDKCVRDVLVHLHEWHKLLLSWVAANQNHRPQPFLPAPYNWKTYGQLNEQIWRDHQATTLTESKRMLLASHEQVMELIGTFNNAELFEKGHFSWTGTTTLGSYCVSATSSHYDWALKKLRAQIKLLRAR